VAPRERGIPEGSPAPRRSGAAWRLVVAVVVAIPAVMIAPMWGMGWTIFYVLWVLGFDRAGDAAANPVVCILFGFSVSALWITRYYRAWMRVAIARLSQ
jgi:hypothetical protein